jgi:ORF6N domain
MNLSLNRHAYCPQPIPTVPHTCADHVVTAAEPAPAWPWAWPRLRVWPRRITQLFRHSGFAVLCKVEIKTKSSRGRPRTTHELINIPAESVESSILVIRSQRVILDRTLARLYGVSTKVLNQAVRRNPERFPSDFVFQLTMEEVKAMEAICIRSQIVTLKKPRGKHIKYRSYAFTEHGILMLSSVLKNERAIEVNIQIMRAFVRLREILASNAELIKRLDELERTYDGHFRIVFDAIRKLVAPAVQKRNPIGFRAKSLKK